MIITQLTDDELKFESTDAALAFLGCDPSSFEIKSIQDELDEYYQELHRRGMYPTHLDIGK